MAPKATCGVKISSSREDSFHPFDGQHVWTDDEPDDRSRFLMQRASSDLFLILPPSAFPFVPLTLRREEG